MLVHCGAADGMLLEDALDVITGGSDTNLLVLACVAVEHKDLAARRQNEELAVVEEAGVIRTHAETERTVATHATPLVHARAQFIHVETHLLVEKALLQQIKYKKGLFDFNISLLACRKALLIWLL